MKQTHVISLIVGIAVIAITAFFVMQGGDSSYLAAAKAGGNYLASHMYEDGSFLYEYDPVAGTRSDNYNILRHAGTTYSLLELFEATNDRRYLRAAENALGYLRASISPCPVYKDALCVLEDDEIKLGGNGLTLLAFAKYMEITGSRDDLERAEGLARFIVDIQAKNGSFLFYKMDGAGVPDSEFISEYYPGEAIFGLTRLAQLSGEREWLLAAHRSATWIITVRDANVATNNLPHDHWMLYALNELHKDKAEPLYVEHAKRLTDAIVAIQHKGLSGEQEDWNGGYYAPPRSTPTATRNEGLGAAYEIFTRSGDVTYAEIARDAMERGVEFTLRTQFTPSKLRETNAAKDALGGFHESLDNTEIRIDYVQHNISALLTFDRISKQ